MLKLEAPSHLVCMRCAAPAQPIMYTNRRRCAGRGGGPVQPESEEDDEDQEARNQELQRIHAELQKADARCSSSGVSPGGLYLSLDSDVR